MTVFGEEIFSELTMLGRVGPGPSGQCPWKRKEGDTLEEGRVKMGQSWGSMASSWAVPKRSSSPADTFTSNFCLQTYRRIHSRCFKPLVYGNQMPWETRVTSVIQIVKGISTGAASWGLMLQAWSAVGPLPPSLRGGPLAAHACHPAS